LVDSKSVTKKISKIKYEKNTSPWKALRSFDPAKRDRKRTRIEPAMLDFRAERERALPAPRGLMGLIAPSLLGTRGGWMLARAQHEN
jgi:hypothetical protein